MQPGLFLSDILNFTHILQLVGFGFYSLKSRHR